jgi:hypothetical protein
MYVYVTFLETSAATAAAVSRTHKHATRASDSNAEHCIATASLLNDLGCKAARFKNDPHVCALPPEAKKAPKIKEILYELVRKYLPIWSDDVRGAGATTFNSFCRIALSLTVRAPLLSLKRVSLS